MSGSCEEDNIAYFGKNIECNGKTPCTNENSKEECSKECARYPDCKYWTWEKTKPFGCYLKRNKGVSVEFSATGNNQYISGCRPSVVTGKFNIM